MANGSWTHGDFFQQKKLKTVEDGSCRVVERGNCVGCRLAAGGALEKARYSETGEKKRERMRRGREKEKEKKNREILESLRVERGEGC